MWLIRQVSLYYISEDYNITVNMSDCSDIEATPTTHYTSPTALFVFCDEIVLALLDQRKTLTFSPWQMKICLFQKLISG